MPESKRIRGYKLVVELRDAGAGGSVSLKCDDGSEHHVPSVNSYSELAALAQLLREEVGLRLEKERIIQKDWQTPGSHHPAAAEFYK